MLGGQQDFGDQRDAHRNDQPLKLDHISVPSIRRVAWVSVFSQKEDSQRSLRPFFARTQAGLRASLCTGAMTNNPTPYFAGPASAIPYKPLTKPDARDRRSPRTSEGWLASLMRAGSAPQRRARSGRKRIASRGR